MKQSRFLKYFLFVLIVSASLANDSTKINNSKINVKDTIQNIVPNKQNIQESASILNNSGNDDWTKTAGFWVALFVAVIALGGLGFGIYQYKMRKKDAMYIKQAELDAKQEHEDNKDEVIRETNETRYHKTLENELSTIKILGSADIESIQVKLMDTFVSLIISETFHSEDRFNRDIRESEMQEKKDFSPEEIIERAFQKSRMMLIIGDPGSGKTTLVKYYTLTNIEQTKWADMTFYLPLRELIWEDGEI